MNLYYDVFETPLGWMGVLASGKGLRQTTLPQTSPDQCVALMGEEIEHAIFSPERFGDLKRKLGLYIQGEAVTFGDELIDVEDASPFLRAAWKACRSIPRGETHSYKWLAAQAGRPQAPRAAGQSMARNPLPVIIPCHRVIASDGGLGGFGKGSSQLELKKRLLELEAGKALVSGRSEH